MEVSRKARPAAKAAPARRPRRDRHGYHHGDLRRVLVAEALQLAAEGGLDAVNIREAARRAGVSPGAPFRHFADRQALLTAVAEEAQRRGIPVQALGLLAQIGVPIRPTTCVIRP